MEELYDMNISEKALKKAFKIAQKYHTTEGITNTPCQCYISDISILPANHPDKKLADYTLMIVYCIEGYGTLIGLKGDNAIEFSS